MPSSLFKEKGRKYASNELDKYSNKWSNLLENFQKQMNAIHKWHLLASQSSNTELAQTTLAVKREREILMVVVSMYRKKFKEAQAEVASNEVSQHFDGKEYQRMSVHFVEAKPFEAMDALTKNFVDLI